MPWREKWTLIFNTAVRRMQPSRQTPQALWGLVLIGMLAFSGCQKSMPNPFAGTTPTQAIARAQGMMRIGNYKGAYEELTQALSLSPQDPFIHLNLGWLYLFTEEPDKATQELKKVLELEPDLPEASHLRGAIYSRLGQEEDALAAYNQALPALANSPDLQFDRAKSLEALTRYPEALATLEKALAVAEQNKEPTLTRYHFAQCSVYYKMKQLKKAQTACDLAAEETPDPAERQRITDFSENLKLLEIL